MRELHAADYRFNIVIGDDIETRCVPRVGLSCINADVTNPDLTGNGCVGAMDTRSIAKFRLSRARQCQDT